jgi:hypothetical protein
MTRTQPACPTALTAGAAGSLTSVRRSSLISGGNAVAARKLVGMGGSSDTFIHSLYRYIYNAGMDQKRAAVKRGKRCGMRWNFSRDIFIRIYRVCERESPGSQPCGCYRLPDRWKQREHARKQQQRRKGLRCRCLQPDYNTATAGLMRGPRAASAPACPRRGIPLWPRSVRCFRWSDRAQ